MSEPPSLPPGQHARSDFPRFGLSRFADRFPRETDRIRLQIAGDIAEPMTLTEEIHQLPRVEQTSDFHCVTTWSRWRTACCSPIAWTVSR